MNRQDNLIKPQLTARLVMGISTMLVIGAVHAFRLGSYLQGDMYIYYYSYASDLMIPFGFYFILTINEVSHRFLRSWAVKAGIVFGLSATTEILQAFDIYFLGVTFDPIDILMFGIGTTLAILVEKLILERFISSWSHMHRSGN